MTDQHPTQFQLECYSSGERVEFHGRSVATHVDACTECGAFLDGLATAKAEFFALQLAPHAFVRQLRARDTEPRARQTVPSWPRWTWTWAWQPMVRWSGVLALAGVVVALHWPEMEVQRAGALLATPSGPRKFATKGGTSFAVIRKRSSDQQLQSGRISIIPGDELRVRFSLPARAKVAAGILADDGTWVPFFEGEFEAGTHTPEATLKVDGNPSSGTVLFGAPADVEHARLHKNFVHVEKAELIWTAPP